MPNNSLKEKDLPQRIYNIAQKVKREIENFTQKNEVKTGDKKADELFDSLIQGLPEFTSIVGKEQHGTHAYSVDIHTLKVLQSCLNHPLYEGLSNSSKTVLKMSALMHDFGKKGGVIDRGHAKKSSAYAKSILEKFNFPKEIKEQIIETVNNHHWFEGYNTGSATNEDIAALCIKPESFKIHQILAKADFENVNENFHLIRSCCRNEEEFSKFMQKKMEPIEEALDEIYSNANFIFDTKFIKNGKLFPTQTIKIGGKEVKLKILDLNKLSDNASLEPYGFAKGTTKADARFLVHMSNDISSDLTDFLLDNNTSHKALWPCSLVSPSNNITYSDSKFGHIYNAEQEKIAKAFYHNMSTGSKK